MRIAVIGAGYVGLTTAATLAYLGHQVSCVDTDPHKINMLHGGKAPFYEPGLNELLVMTADNLDFTTSYTQALQGARAVFLAVGTPPLASGAPDLSQYWDAVDMVVEYAKNSAASVLLVTKSTVPVGTGSKLYKRLVLQGLNFHIIVGSNPEFLRQGSALSDSFFPDRLVLGGNDEAQELFSQIYAPMLAEPGLAAPDFLTPPWYHGIPPVYRVDLRTAELSKYAANAFLAMKISFINEMGNIAELVGADIRQVADVIGADPRIGRLFLNAGIGYGGSCFPKDTRALKYMADVRGYDVTLLSAVINVNNQQPYRLVSKLNQALGGLEEKVVCILGLTFKPGTDDLREAPSIPIIHTLVDAGACVRVHDPVAPASAQSLLPPQVIYCSDVEAALSGSDALAILTEWSLYQALDPLRVKELMRGDVVIDGRNCLDPQLFSRHLRYWGMGQGADSPAELKSSVIANRFATAGQEIR